MIILLLSQLGSALLSNTATFTIGFVTAPCCGIVPTLASEMVPWAASTAISVQKASEQLGVFVKPMVGGGDWCPGLSQRPYRLRYHRPSGKPDFPFWCNRAKSIQGRTEREMRG